MRIKEATTKDDVLSLFKHVIQNGLPQTTNELPEAIQHYWNFCDQKTIEDGLILKNIKIVIPVTLQHKMLEKVHDGHVKSWKMY